MVLFSSQIYQGSRPLRIGYMENDGYTQPSPSNARGVREVKALLEEAGHTVRRQWCSQRITHHGVLTPRCWNQTFIIVTLLCVVGAIHPSEDARGHQWDYKGGFCRRDSHDASETVSPSLWRGYVISVKNVYDQNPLIGAKSLFKVTLPSTPAHPSLSLRGVY